MSSHLNTETWETLGKINFLICLCLYLCFNNNFIFLLFYCHCFHINIFICALKKQNQKLIVVCSCHAWILCKTCQGFLRQHSSSTQCMSDLLMKITLYHDVQLSKEANSPSWRKNWPRPSGPETNC